MAQSKAPMTGTDVRNFYRANPTLAAKFSEHDRKALAAGARGRLPESMRKGIVKDAGRRFAEGTAKTVPLTIAKVQGGKTRKVVKHIPEVEARRLAGSVAGKRGPLSAAALKAAAANYTGV